MSSADLPTTNVDGELCPVLTLLNAMFSGGFAKRRERAGPMSKLPSWLLSTRKTDGRIFIRCCACPEDCELETFLAWGRTGTSSTATPDWSLPETDRL